jgi:hypothetical protein
MSQIIVKLNEENQALKQQLEQDRINVDRRFTAIEERLDGKRRLKPIGER